MTGFLLIDKAKGPTSHDVVQAVRTITGERRCGHTGTLDPFATGLLPICLGRATRLARFLSGANKTYWAVVRFGFATDTYDSTGQVMGTVSRVSVEPETLGPVLETFLGRQLQIPPPFAAKKVQGRRMYRLARAGLPIELKPVEVVVNRIDLLDVRGDRATMDIEVESGTYIRSLAHDLGKRLGFGAHLEELRRTRVGSLQVGRALALDELDVYWKTGRAREAVLEPSTALCDLPALELGEEGVRKVCHGNAVTQDDFLDEPAAHREGQPLRLLDTGGSLLAIGTWVKESEIIQPLVVMQPGDMHQSGKPSPPRALQARDRVV